MREQLQFATSVPSDSLPDVLYLVHQRNGVYECSCPSYKFGKRPCKHIQNVIAMRSHVATSPIEEDNVNSIGR